MQGESPNTSVKTSHYMTLVVIDAAKPSPPDFFFFFFALECKNIAFDESKFNDQKKIMYLEY